MEKTALPVHDATANHRSRHEEKIIKIKIKIKKERSRNLDSAPSARVNSSFLLVGHDFIDGKWINQLIPLDK